MWRICTMTARAPGGRVVVVPVYEFRPSAPWLTRLSSGDVAVLRLLVGGRTYGEIAEEMGVSTSAARARVAGLVAKMGVRDRSQAVAEAYQSGFVQPGDATPW
ncbi:LuxR family transcriptional regulator [Nocardioides immobilis]|uniref:LuxR family transcriptional regulator n=1 Tax=Nocardioides immobilis TaxID=2049295 RepID=A0A417XZL7_9ACTN|nr:LuxR family transcriptional regulator [Nocardioides immobilis]